MIIRTRHTRNFTVIPNSIHDDDRLSLEARGLLGYLLSRPPSWEIRHDVLRRKFYLSRQRLDGIVTSLMAAGYVVREANQPRDENKRFTSYDYIVHDTPVSDVGSPIAGRRRRESDIENKKGEIKKSNNKLSPLSPLTPEQEPQEGSRNEYSEFGLQALSQGMSPVFIDSKPFQEWQAFRGPDGMPPQDFAVINGKRRSIVWFPTVYPPSQSSDNEGDCR